MTETIKWASASRSSGRCGLGQQVPGVWSVFQNACSVPAGPASGLAPRPQTAGGKQPTAVPHKKPQFDHLEPWPQAQPLSSHHGRAPPWLREGAAGRSHSKWGPAGPAPGVARTTSAHRGVPAGPVLTVLRSDPWSHSVVTPICRPLRNRPVSEGPSEPCSRFCCTKRG